MHDWPERVKDFLIRVGLAWVVIGAIMAALAVTFVLLRYAAHLF